MSDYMEAYGRRMKRNNDYLLKIAGELKTKGCSVFGDGKHSRYMSFLKIIKDDKHVIFGFTDVPYRWYLQCSITPNIKTGSGRTLKEIPDNNPSDAIEHDPCTTDEIINLMQPNPPKLQTFYLNEL